ncbi:Zn-dependent membrane protease YugP [Paenibacillus harenae]|uniref:Zn-dependent membrane protease YugP n=1 Tax=Paenibacillus harenae TaxID=306543 RepID=A0ABT9TWN4_PAEHA|nr:Zn-dependent membrane protease YugP [Paenibacillus harenae]
MLPFHPMDFWLHLPYASGLNSASRARSANGRARRGLTGYEAARLLHDASGLRNVPIEPVRGSLTDHYDPVHRIVRLSAVNFASATAPFLFLAVLLFTSSTLIAVLPRY